MANKKQEPTPLIVDVAATLAPIQQVDQLRWHCHWESGVGCQEPAAYRVHFTSGEMSFSYGSCEGHLEKMKLQTRWVYVSHELIDYNEKRQELRTKL